MFYKIKFIVFIIKKAFWIKILTLLFLCHSFGSIFWYSSVFKWMLSTTDTAIGEILWEARPSCTGYNAFEELSLIQWLPDIYSCRHIISDKGRWKVNKDNSSYKIKMWWYSMVYNL